MNSPDPGYEDEYIKPPGLLCDDLVPVPGEELSDKAPTDASGAEEDQGSASFGGLQNGGSRGPAPAAEVVPNTVASIPVFSR